MQWIVAKSISTRTEKPVCSNLLISQLAQASVLPGSCAVQQPWQTRPIPGIPPVPRRRLEKFFVEGSGIVPFLTKLSLWACLNKLEQKWKRWSQITCQRLKILTIFWKGKEKEILQLLKLKHFLQSEPKMKVALKKIQPSLYWKMSPFCCKHTENASVKEC